MTDMDQQQDVSLAALRAARAIIKLSAYFDFSQGTTTRIAEVIDCEFSLELERLRSTLRTIADFAVGNGDVCEIIARRARAALNPPENI